VAVFWYFVGNDRTRAYETHLSEQDVAELWELIQTASVVTISQLASTLGSCLSF